MDSFLSRGCRVPGFCLNLLSHLGNRRATVTHLPYGAPECVERDADVRVFQMRYEPSNHDRMAKFRDQDHHTSPIPHLPRNTLRGRKFQQVDRFSFPPCPEHAQSILYGQNERSRPRGSAPLRLVHLSTITSLPSEAQVRRVNRPSSSGPSRDRLRGLQGMRSQAMGPHR